MIKIIIKKKKKLNLIFLKVKITKIPKKIMTILKIYLVQPLKTKEIKYFNKKNTKNKFNNNKLRNKNNNKINNKKLKNKNKY